MTTGSNSPSNNMMFVVSQAEMVKAKAYLGHFQGTLNRLKKEGKIDWKERSEKRRYMKQNYNKILGESIVIF